MQLLVYILVYPVLLFISILPFRVLYGLSDIVYFIMYYLIGYRRKVIYDNLNLAFPDKSDEEIKQIQKRFYSHMIDMFLEMIKSLSISKSELSKRFIITNPEELKRLEAMDKSIMIMFGHYASYEWSFVVESHISYKGAGVYKKIKNVYFDKLVRRIRSKYNTTLIPTKEAKKTIAANEANNIKTMYALVSDQSPKHFESAYWTTFMGIKVPCFKGAEMLAKSHNMSVTYLKTEKVKRGHYKAEIVPIADNAKDFEDYQITEAFTRLLEQQIHAAPEYYLWTHKRWKHRDKADQF